jgi:uncharacterized BrkB/YihY/UPF0761 family membrane protein
MKRFLLALSIIGKLVLSVLICWYFWSATNFISIKYIDFEVLIFTVIYIVLQLFTRKLTNVQNWWDWVYYGGLVSIMVSALLVNLENFNLFHSITTYGTLCLILPALVDGFNFVIKKD